MLMILGLSHIAISSSNIEAATERLFSLGYTQRFDLPNLENNIAKIAFLNNYQGHHHIRALAAVGAMAIELIDHGPMAGPQTSALIPIFRSEFPCPDWIARSNRYLPISPTGITCLESALGTAPLSFYDSVLSLTLLWIPAKGEPSGLYACVVPTDQPEETASILRQLRFRSDSSGLWSLLTPLPALQARLIPVLAQPADGWTPVTVLDAPGSACLALMARTTDQDLIPDALRKEATSFKLRINNKTLLINLARPDHCPIVELVNSLS